MAVFRNLLTVAMVCLAGISIAAPRHGIGIPPQGKVQVNLNGGLSWPFVNMLKSAANGGDPRVGCAIGQSVDNNGYPVTGGPCQDYGIQVDIPLTTTYSGNYVIKQRFVTVGTPNPSPGGAFRLQINDAFTVVTGSGFVTGCSAPPVCTFGGVISGTNPRVVVTFGSLTTGGGRQIVHTIFAASVGTFTTPDITFCRSDQEGLDDVTAANDVALNPDFVATMKRNAASTVVLPTTGATIPALNPSTIRYMDLMNANSSILSQFGYEPPITAVSYTGVRWQPSAWAGGAGTAGTIASASNAGVTYTAGAPADWSVLSNGVMLQGRVTSNSAGTLPATAMSNNGSGAIHLTMASTTGLSNGQVISLSGQNTNGIGQFAIDVVAGGIDLRNSVFVTASGCACTVSTATLAVGSTAAHIIANVDGATALVNDQTFTFVYDAYGANGAGVWQVNNRLIQTWPMSVIVKISNTLNVPPWYTIPFWYTDASLTAMATYNRDNLNSNLSPRFELANECWNHGFNCQNWGWQRGQTMNLIQPTVSSANPEMAYVGLRSLQMFHLIEDAYAATGKTNYKKVLPVQLGGCCGPFQSWMLEGQNLAPSGTHTGTGNANYAAFTFATQPSCTASGCDYTQVGNRPIDHADVLTYATYSNGAQIASPLNGQIWNLLPTSNGPGGFSDGGLTGAADSFALNTSPAIAAAYAFVDWDLTHGYLNSFTVTGRIDNGTPATTGNVLTISAFTFGNTGILDVNYHIPNDGFIYKINGTGVTAGTIIIDQISGSPGQTGTYHVNNSQTVGSETITGYISGFGTLDGNKFLYQKWETVLAGYAHFVGVEAYEGSISPNIFVCDISNGTAVDCTTGSAGPNAACDRMTIAHTYCGVNGTIYNMLEAYKQTSSYQAVVKQSFDDFFSYAHSVGGGGPAWYSSFGQGATDSGTTWSARERTIYDPPLYTSWDAMAAYNH